MTQNTTPTTHTTTTSSQALTRADDRAFTQMLQAHPACRPSITPPPPPPFTLHPPSYFTQYELPPDAILVGDCHLTRGDITLIAGVPGCGKSRLLMSLAIAGKEGAGSSWMGLPVHTEFKTMILQAENGEVRLKQELGDITKQGHALDGHLLITPPPPGGLAFTTPEFCEAVRAAILRERPGIFAIDPWNRAVLDDKVRDFREVLNAVQSCIPDIPDKPAIVILHHLRKGGSGDGRKTGRDLLNEISGSYIIGSASRCAFILEPASPDPEDHRVVFTCAKNNNGDMGKSTAWHRQNGLFVECADFDWKEWREGSGAGRKAVVELEDLAAVFENGKRMLSKTQAVKALKDAAGIGTTAAYAALKPDGRFADHLSEASGFLTFRL